MAIATFDTLEYSKSLQDAGMERNQADAFARAQAKAMADMQNSLEKQNEASRRELATKGDLKDLELRLTTRLGAMIAASVAIVAALVKWL